MSDETLDKLVFLQSRVNLMSVMTETDMLQCLTSFVIPGVAKL